MARIYIDFYSEDDLLVWTYVGKEIANAIITLHDDVGNLVPEDLSHGQYL